MADQPVFYDDTVASVIATYSARLAARPEPDAVAAVILGAEPLPGEDWPAVLVIVETDGDAETSFLTTDESIRINVHISGANESKRAMDLGRLIRALRVYLPGVTLATPPNPIAVVQSSAGPFLVTDTHPGARAFLNLTLGLGGRTL